MAPSADARRIRDRKGEHLEIALGEHDRQSPGWTDVELVHDALPELDLGDIDLTTNLFGRPLRAPIVISGMTGGHRGSIPINATLARAAQKHGIALGIGSQRAALVDAELEPTYTVAREHAPDALLIGNLGATQLVEQPDQAALGLSDVQRAIEMVRADALAIHLNFLEELIQPEGDRRGRGCAAAIASVVRGLDVPVLVKETGAGMARITAERVAELGVAGLDVGGAGGTSFAAIEHVRAKRQKDERGTRLGAVLGGWGISTAVSIVAARSTGLPVVATGGIRSGLDAAKAFSLGATAVGIARPLLQAAKDGDDALDAWLGGFLDELKAVMLLTGSRCPSDLVERPLVIGGRTALWLDQLGFSR